jgi:hypothetical protein
MMMVTDPFAARKLEEESAVEAAVGAEVDVLDDGRLAQPGLAQAAGEPLVLAAGRFAVNEQPEPKSATCVFAKTEAPFKQRPFPPPAGFDHRDNNVPPETKFAVDSLLEGQGFEPSVPRRVQHFSGLPRSRSEPALP